jgi:hypothetical protein
LAVILTFSFPFLVGLSTILIVVCFVCLLQNAVVRSSSIFVRLSETQVGEADIVLLPDLATLQSASSEIFPPFWINETLVRSQLAESNSATVLGTAPRWTLLAKGLHPNTGKNSSVIVLVGDSNRESEIGLGRTWVRRPLKFDECYVSASLLG